MTLKVSLTQSDNNDNQQIFVVLRKHQQTDERKRKSFFLWMKVYGVVIWSQLFKKEKTQRQRCLTCLKTPNDQISRISRICGGFVRGKRPGPFWVWKIRRITGALWADFKTLIAVSLHVRSKANGLWRMSAPRWTSSNTDCDIYNWRSEETEGGTEGRSGLVFVSHILLIQFIPVIDTFYWTLSAGAPYFENHYLK